MCVSQDLPYFMYASSTRFHLETIASKNVISASHCFFFFFTDQPGDKCIRPNGGQLVILSRKKRPIMWKDNNRLGDSQQNH